MQEHEVEATPRRLDLGARVGVGLGIHGLRTTPGPRCPNRAQWGAARDEGSASGVASAVDSGGDDEPEGGPRVDAPLDVVPVEDQLADRIEQASGVCARKAAEGGRLPSGEELDP